MAGAFFTPSGLARDLAIEVTGKRIIDLCAGIGALAFAAFEHSGRKAEITCVEINPDYYEVGKKILPEATWIQADVMSLHPPTRMYDCVIANPPFGNVKTHSNRYGCFEYDLIAMSRYIARDGVFIIPQMSSPFKLSGQRHFEKTESDKYLKFVERTGIHLTPNCGLDTSVYGDDWKGINHPPVEIVLGFEKQS